MSPEVRLCLCGCGKPIVPLRRADGKLEAASETARKRYADAECYKAHRRAQAAHRLSEGRTHPKSRKRSMERLKTPLSARHYGLGPLQPFAFTSPNPKRHDLIAERESGIDRPEPSDDELRALLKVCLELHEPMLECWEEHDRAALPVTRVPRAGTGRARWQS